ncbi:MAG: prepilin-type N-terminal cleavage/methylation domain-containing protein [Chthonomonadales bacterium]
MKLSLRVLGFTLVELLITIAIIAVLAALLFPVFAGARKKAQQTTCASNERQIGLALGMYEQDFDQTYPNFRFWPLDSKPGITNEPHSWRSAIFTYLNNNQVLRCPANHDNDKVSYDPQFNISYAANVAQSPKDFPVFPPALDSTGSGVFGKDLSPGVKSSSVIKPGECIAIVEIAHVPDSLFVVDIATDFDSSPHRYSDCLFLGHNGLGNYLFVDGHVKALKPTATYRGDEANYWYRDASPLGAEARSTLSLAESGSK